MARRRPCGVVRNCFHSVMYWCQAWGEKRLAMYFRVWVISLRRLRAFIFIYCAKYLGWFCGLFCGGFGFFFSSGILNLCMFCFWVLYFFMAFWRVWGLWFFSRAKMLAMASMSRPTRFCICFGSRVSTRFSMLGFLMWARVRWWMRSFFCVG